MESVEEWAVAFNILWNNIASDKAPGLEPYEISRFLTNAQETIVVSLYKGATGNAFESTEEVTNYLATLIKQDTGKMPNAVVPHIYKESTVFELPKDLLFRTWEECTIINSCNKEVSVPVIPITQDEFWRTVRNPFKKQNDQRVLRLAYSTENGDKDTLVETKYVELISDNSIANYVVRYLAKPSPIILEKLENGLTINGETDAMTCKLPEVLHQTILAEAVRMAKAVWNM